MGTLKAAVAGAVMPGGRGRFLASGALSAVLIVTLGAAAAASAAGPRARSGAVTNYKFGLNAVSVLSSSDAWAVGDGATVLHWNGTSWAPVTIPGLPAASSLYTVDALSSSDVWAAGTAQANTPFSVQRTLIVHWDGAAWTRVTSPGPSGRGLFVQLRQLSMDSATDGWAVGSTYNEHTNVSTGLALRWDGTNWTVMAVPSPGIPIAGTSGLVAVAAIGPANVWAVGYTDTIGDNGNDEAPVSVHWNCTRWSQLTAPNPPGSSNGSTVLLGMGAAGPGNIWAVGRYAYNVPGGMGPAHTLILHWNGARWVRS